MYYSLCVKVKLSVYATRALIKRAFDVIEVVFYINYSTTSQSFVNKCSQLCSFSFVRQFVVSNLPNMLWTVYLLQNSIVYQFDGT